MGIGQNYSTQTIIYILGCHVKEVYRNKTITYVAQSIQCTIARNEYYGVLLIRHLGYIRYTQHHNRVRIIPCLAPTGNHRTNWLVRYVYLCNVVV